MFITTKSVFIKDLVKPFMSSKKDSLTKQFKTQFLRQDLQIRKTWLDEKSERSTERENEDVSEWMYGD